VNHLFETALVNLKSNYIEETVEGFLEGPLNGGLDQVFLQVVREGPRGQLKRFIERMNAVAAIATVGKAGDVDFASPARVRMVRAWRRR
jgi:hypothetical protein